MEAIVTALGPMLQVAMGVSLAACAGLRAFLPLLVVGVAGRLEIVPLAESFEWLASGPALVVLTTAVVVEAVADKVPVVDHLLDVVAILVRPVAGALVVASSLTALDPLVASVLGLVLGSTVAGGIHAVKSQTRLASTITTGGTANPLLSFIEEGVALAGSIAAVLLPLLAFTLLLAGLVLLLRYRRRRREAQAMGAGVAAGTSQRA